MSELPIAVVLCAAGEEPPTGLGELDGRLTIRYTDSARLADAMPGARVLFLWDFFSTAVEEVWPRCRELEWIHVAAAGVDTLLFPELRDSDVVVTNARGVFDRPIAEFVLASVLAHAKLLHESRDHQRAHRWVHREPRSLAGARALVVGTGGIGRATARLLRAAGMDVRGAGRSATAEDPDFGVVVSSSDLPGQVGWADHVVNAAPLTDATRGLFDSRVFGAMKPTAHFVNVGRGASVVVPDLLAALETGQLAGASLDVFESEPLPADSPLWDAPGVVVSAHMSGDVVGWRDALAAQFLTNALRWLDGRPLENIVDKQLGYVRKTS